MRGIEKFKEYFEDYADQYVLIGGAACDLILNETDVTPRATKDLDIVLIVEALTPAFGKRFWEFIRAGGYTNKTKSGGAPQFYRFGKPSDAAFPLMIELMSHTHNAFGEDGGDITKIPFDDSISSLSAILLNYEYYRLLFDGRSLVSGISLLSSEYLLVFKVKAWLDLSDRKNKGENVKSTDISKHLTDIIRLTAVLPAGLRIELPTEVSADMKQFVVRYKESPVDPRSIGMKEYSAQNVLDAIEKIY